MNPDAGGVSQVVPGSPGHRMVAEPSFRSGGSLPFKKRKLYRSGSGSASDYSQNEPKSPCAIGNIARDPLFGGSDDKKIAALALVAAASSTLPVSFPGLVFSPVSINQHNSQEEAKRKSTESLASSAPSLPQDVSDASSPIPVATLKATGKLRVHHPPLRSPLPGGCHGRTARNNSYCRRHPCYNGSKYCKLHYQMHVVALRQDGSNAKNPIADKARNSPLPPVHTDKRFQGLDGEVKCCATTTRGRPCTYVSVNGTKYCFLHADYDSNPPPRRGSNASSLKRRAAFVASASATESVSGDDILTSEGHRGTTLFKTPNKLPASVTSDESSLSSSAWVTPQTSSVSDSSTSSEKRKDVSTRNGKALLSSLSYDQWFNKQVCIATGPLANHIGRVVKWGNGWVTVRIAQEDPTSEDDALLHNRRAVELYLIPEEAEAETLVVENVPREADDRTSQLLRCVSREIEATASETDSVRSRLSPSELSGTCLVNATETKPEACGGDDTTLEAPNEATVSSEEESLPLVKSLMLAQEQGLRKNQGLDLLFGTAALERGRRNISKPTRYEDTAMIEKPQGRTPVSSPRSPNKRTPAPPPRSLKGK